MASIRKLALPLSFLFVCTSLCAQQKAAPNWDAWRFLQGKWVGEGSNERAQGSGYFSFEPDLQNKVWVRRNHAEYPSRKDQSAAVHEDLMIVYLDQSTGQTRAFYCDTEGHIINYTAEFSSDGKKLIFLGDRKEGTPQYRLTYTLDSPGHMSVILEMTEPTNADHWHQLVQGKVRKVAAS
jgi:hypothetical protein